MEAKKKKNLQISRDAINDHINCRFSPAISQDPKSFTHTVWRIAHNAIKNGGSPQWRVGKIGSERIQEFALDPILVKILVYAQFSGLFATEATAINVCT